MHRWVTTRGGKILLLGSLCLLLQQVAVPYLLELWGHSAKASLVHLHTGLLLAMRGWELSVFTAMRRTGA